MKYDYELIKELSSQIDLLEYASQSMEFEKKGLDSYATHCPKHIDKTPSLCITPSKNMYHCFSCGRAGILINWLVDFEDLNFHQAVEKLSKLTNTKIGEFKQSELLGFYKQVKSLYNKEETHSVERQILSYSEYEKYSETPPNEWVEEGISVESLHKFDIRVDNSTNRIVYPIYDANFNLIGVKGRTRFKDFKTLKIAKYMNYHKIMTTDFFVGMKENYESIKQKNEIIIVEGIKSVMKLNDFGYDNAVAAETSTLNDEQIKLLIKMGIKNVVIAFDNDVDIKKIYSCTEMLKRFSNVYILRDRVNISNRLLPEEKMSPCDAGKDVFDRLYEERKRI